MRILRILLAKIFGDAFCREKIEVDKVRIFLLGCYKDPGFRNYYSLRKKYLLGMFALGVEGREYWETVGRLKELQALSGNANNEFIRVSKEQKVAKFAK